MSGAVERAARALWDAAACGSDPEPWDRTAPWAREDYRGRARAAIAAIRDPTEAMIEAGVSAAASVRPEGVPLIWRAMVEKALECARNRASAPVAPGLDPAAISDAASQEGLPAPNLRQEGAS